MADPVVVGVDGSARSLAAVETAAGEAALRRRRLRIVHALVWVPFGMDMDPAVVPPVHQSHWVQAESCVAEAQRIAAERAPEVDVTAEVIPGRPATVLLHESEHAALLVLGDHGLGGVAELMIGSVALQTATHGRCPVLVARGTKRADGPVVVGVDGSASSSEAVRFAADEAAMRGAELVTLHAWNGGDDTELGAELPMSYDTWSGEDEERRVLAEAVAGIGAKHPDLRVRRQVINGSARGYLTAWSRTAQLVVVGSRGHGGFAGLLLGSVGHHLLHHAACPVAVVRP